MTARRVSLLVLLASGSVFLVLAAVLVPWQPVPGGPLVDAPARSVFSAAEIARAEQFAWWARAWSWGSLLVSLAVAVLLGLTPLGTRLLARLPGPWWARVVAAVALVLGAGRLATLPFAVAGRVHARDHGLSGQSWWGFAADLSRGLAVEVVVTSVALLVLVGSARRWRRAWPAVAAAVLGSLVLLGSFAYPVLVEPLFNEFTPLPASPLRSAVLELADREGVVVEEVLVADASRRTTTLNAYVSGFGGTRRVVLYDTLVTDLPADQVLSVVAHELAHARHRDVLVGSLLGAWGMMVAVGALGLAVGSGPRRRIDDPTVVPWVLALVAIGSLLVSPVSSLLSRQLETRADVEALRATGDGAMFVAMQRELALRALSDPSPPAWAHLWFGSHPTVLRRVALAERVAP